MKQGSVLSPILFLLVMDPLLRKLEASGLGLNLHNYYAGGFLHADDIRTLATSTRSLEEQINIVKGYCDENFLRLNISKCEVITFSGGSKAVVPQCKVGGSMLPARHNVKCLGYWWGHDLLATRAVEENIMRARRAFFHYGSIGAFQGDLSPLSSKSVYEVCVLPILLYGCENWVLTQTLIDRLEAFQGEIVKRMLKWPRHHSNTAACVTVRLQSVKNRMLARKLRFLQRVLQAEERSASGKVCLALCDDVMSMSVVKECRELEELCGVAVTEKLVNGDIHWSREMIEDFRQLNHSRMLRRCSERAPLIVQVEERVGWARLWDATLDLGVHHIRGLQALSRLMSHHGRGCWPCPLCAVNPVDGPILEHILSSHKDRLHLNLDTEQVVEKLADLSLSFLARFKNLFYTYS